TVDSSAFAQGHGEAKPAISPHTRFVARQPILTKEEKVFGYELLFRDGVEDYFRATDPDAASRNTLDSSILLGLDVLCGGQRAFINCTREVLLKDYMTLLPPNQAVAEILETVPGDDLVKAACGRLKEAGFMTAREIPANRLNYLRMLQAVSQPELDPKEIENVIKSEASICYRLLRYLNSAVFGFPSEIHSVRHALSILGEREVRRWVRLVATLGAGQGKSSELVLSALVRARF